MEDKELLLKDLCGRLPYKCVYSASRGITHWNKLILNIDTITKLINNEYDEIKPYLRPMSSMTEEECLELSKLKPIYDEVAAWKYIKTPVPLAIVNIEQFDFFHSRHLDWRDLIPKGLALEAPEGMYGESKKYEANIIPPEEVFKVMNKDGWVNIGDGLKMDENGNIVGGLKI